MADSDNDDLPILWSTAIDLLVLFIIIVIFVLTAIAIGTQIPQFEFSTTVIIANTIGSLALSSILAYLYLRMSSTQAKRNKIQEQQRDILIQQKNFLEASYRPGLVIEQWEGENNCINILLSNIGRGPAQDIGMVVQVSKYDFDSYSFEKISYNPKEKRKLQRIYSSLTNKNILTRDENSVDFTQEVHTLETRGKPQEQMVVPFSSICEELQYDQPETIVLSVCIVYDDILGNTQTKQLWLVALEYENESSLEEMLNKEEVLELHRTEDTVAPNNAPDDLQDPGPY